MLHRCHLQKAVRQLMLALLISALLCQPVGGDRNTGAQFEDALAEDDEYGESPLSLGAEEVLERGDDDIEGQGIEDTRKLGKKPSSYYADVRKLSARVREAIDRAGLSALQLKQQATNLMRDNDYYNSDFEKLSDGLKNFNIGVNYFRDATTKKHKGITKRLATKLREGMEAGRNIADPEEREEVDQRRAEHDEVQDTARIAEAMDNAAEADDNIQSEDSQLQANRADYDTQHLSDGQQDVFNSDIKAADDDIGGLDGSKEAEINLEAKAADREELDRIDALDQQGKLEEDTANREDQAGDNREEQPDA